MRKTVEKPEDRRYNKWDSTVTGDIVMGTVQKACFLLLFCAAVLTGCEEKQEEEWIPQQTAMVVAENGTITETILEKLDQSYYNADELTGMITQSVEAYDREHTADAVTIDALQIESGSVDLVMTYQTWQDYAQYNHVPFYNGTMLGAELEGFLFSGSFQKVGKRDRTVTPVSRDEVLSHKEHLVLITDDSHQIKVPGRILYMSTTAALVTDTVAGPSRKEEKQGLVLPSSTVYYAVDEMPGTQEERDLSYLYIIYDYE